MRDLDLPPLLRGAGLLLLPPPRGPSSSFPNGFSFCTYSTVMVRPCSCLPLVASSALIASLMSSYCRGGEGRNHQERREKTSSPAARDAAIGLGVPSPTSGQLHQWEPTHLNEGVVALDLNALDATKVLKVAVQVALTHALNVEVHDEDRLGGLDVALTVGLGLLYVLGSSKRKVVSVMEQVGCRCR